MKRIILIAVSCLVCAAGFAQKKKSNIAIGGDQPGWAKDSGPANVQVGANVGIGKNGKGYSNTISGVETIAIGKYGDDVLTGSSSINLPLGAGSGFRSGEQIKPDTKNLPMKVTGRASFTGNIDTGKEANSYQLIANSKQLIPEDTTGSIRDAKGNILFNPHTDSIPPLADTANFVNNQDLADFLGILKQVMDNDAYRQAKDNFSRYELITYYTNQVLLRARARWELAHKVKKKTVK